MYRVYIYNTILHRFNNQLEIKDKVTFNRLLLKLNMASKKCVLKFNLKSKICLTFCSLEKLNFLQAYIYMIRTWKHIYQNTIYIKSKPLQCSMHSARGVLVQRSIMGGAAEIGPKISLLVNWWPLIQYKN